MSLTPKTKDLVAEWREARLLYPLYSALAREFVIDLPACHDLEDIERATIQRVFEQVKGDKALAGKMLGISRATLYRKLKRYNIGGREEVAASQSLQ